MLKSIKINGMLSFRDASLDLQPLNVLIGPNASGKSNLIEIIALLQATPRDLAGFIRRNGGITDWLWKGENASRRQVGTVEVLLDISYEPMPVRYILSIAERGQQLDVVEESLENEKPLPGFEVPNYLFQFSNGYGRLTRQDNSVEPNPPIFPHITPGQSILKEIREPTLYPGITFVGRRFDAIHLYREWNMGRSSGIRRPQQADAPNNFLEEDFTNLALVLNKLELGRGGLSLIEQNLSRFYEMYDRVLVGIDANTARLLIREKGLSKPIPATRLSDGTLRFLSLLTILCHPNPPPLICIEEPELGMHPDIIPLLAELLRDASERTQLIVTTHSERLIDELSDIPESVVVCERGPEFGTEFKRLSSKQLGLWLEKYRLGELWQKGELGGVRW